MTESSAHNNTHNASKILSSTAEIKAAVIKATADATRALAIQTPDLEPDIYDQEDFLDTLKKFVLARGFARVRVLITNPRGTLKSGNNFVSMGRRLNSYIEFRSLKPEQGERTDAFFIVDEKTMIYRPRIDRWEAELNPFEPAVTRYYLDGFDELWHACAPGAELRLSQL